MISSDSKKRLFTALSVLFPGDHIHDVAPTSAQRQASWDRVSALDRAEAKRNRKNRLRAQKGK